MHNLNFFNHAGGVKIKKTGAVVKNSAIALYNSNGLEFYLYIFFFFTLFVAIQYAILHTSLVTFCIAFYICIYSGTLGVE